MSQYPRFVIKHSTCFQTLISATEKNNRYNNASVIDCLRVSREAGNEVHSMAMFQTFSDFFPDKKVLICLSAAKYGSVEIIMISV